VVSWCEGSKLRWGWRLWAPTLLDTHLSFLLHLLLSHASQPPHHSALLTPLTCVNRLHSLGASSPFRFTYSSYMRYLSLVHVSSVRGSSVCCGCRSGVWCACRGWLLT
jgi:hypothetical protein